MGESNEQNITARQDRCEIAQNVESSETTGKARLIGKVIAGGGIVEIATTGNLRNTHKGWNMRLKFYT